MKELLLRIKQLKKILNDSEHVIIGAGSGLSTAAGIDYGGKRFQDNFEDYIRQYGFTDMYTSSFYPFKTEEEKWAYWARHINLNNTGMDATILYKKLFQLVENKDYFVITTNVDDQFIKSGFDERRVFATQGSYRLMQCQKACHNKLYDDSQLVENLLENTNNFRVPAELVPKCPVCSGPMEVNLRKDNYFVEDPYWHARSRDYQDFLNKSKDDKTVLLEFGIGYNTPAIIRFPFESMASRFPNWTLARFNNKYLELAIESNGTFKLTDDYESLRLVNNFQNRYIPFKEDIEEIIDSLNI